MLVLAVCSSGRQALTPVSPVPTTSTQTDKGAGAAASSSGTGPKRRQLDTTRQGVRVWLVKVPVRGWVGGWGGACVEGKRLGSPTD